MKRPLSIRARFLLVSFASVPLALALAALVLVSLFSRNLEQRMETEIGGLLNNLVAAVRFQPDGRLAPPLDLLERRFTTPYGGLYWQIEDQGTGTQLRSPSLWDFTFALPANRPVDLPGDGEMHSFELAGPDDTRLLARERHVTIASPSGPREVRIIVAADRAPLDEASRTFALDILPYIVGLAIFLIGASLIQLTFGLRPLSLLKEQLDRVRERRGGERMDGLLPREFEPVESALNRLLDSQSCALRKARDRAGDLAHGLRTPLTVLANDALTLRERKQDDIADEIEDLAELMRMHVERELARSRIVANAEMRQSDGDLAAIVAQIVRTLKRTETGGNLAWEIGLPEPLVLPVDPHDLRELVGNVLENASKWARTRVSVRWQSEGTSGALVVEDDGTGIDPAKIDSMTLRGVRYDQQVPGTGLGLAIVREICEIYDLTLDIRNRRSGGLRVSVGFPRDVGVR